MVFGLKTKTKFCSVLFSQTRFSSDMLRVSPDPSGSAGLRIQQCVCANGENMQDKTFVFWPVRPCKLVVKLTALSSLSEFIPGQAVGKHSRARSCWRARLPRRGPGLEFPSAAVAVLGSSRCAVSHTKSFLVSRLDVSKQKLESLGLAASTFGPSNPRCCCFTWGLS